jgi:tRNA pseudouridine38-40 synthase
MPLQNIRLLIEYKGSAFSGWQIQDGPRTVQAEITVAIRKVTGCEVEVIGAGRTDAGVHALGQVANFHIDHRLEPERYRDALNFYLPEDIRIKQSVSCDDGFHARFDAIWRRYRYLVSPERSAIYREQRWENATELDFSLLRQSAELIKGEHDFGPFCVVASRKEDNSCTVFGSQWYRIGPLMVYEIRGNRFLHSMVRSLVGAMINLATVKRDNNVLNLTLSEFADIIGSRTEERITFTAPPRGLYLVSVGYRT